MPTGYTATLMKSGQTFPEFVMGCARAFGACVTLRDDPQDVPIPDKFEPSKYHVLAKAKAKAERGRLAAMGEEERIAFGREEQARTVAQLRENLQIARDENARLLVMRGAVESWEPPTPEHAGLKEFMLEQLSISMLATPDIESYVCKAEAKPPLKYWQGALDGAKQNIVYHEEEQVKETERAAGRTTWIQALRDSLGTRAGTVSGVKGD